MGGGMGSTEWEKDRGNDKKKTVPMKHHSETHSYVRLKLYQKITSKQSKGLPISQN